MAAALEGFVLTTLIVLFALWVPPLSRALPVHTPGSVTSQTTAMICGTRWGLDRRHVTVAMKREVARRYGLQPAHWKDVEFDHLIPRELGGADAVDNLWPQPWAEAKQKDRVENLLHRRVCAGQLELFEARVLVRRWWEVR